tara:strand:- start:934 stop:1479 length:546 start_codon:yes stop_codon:yes gene_type:complete
MKKIFDLINLSLIVFLAVFFIPTSAFAKCNIGFKLGENIKQVEEKFGHSIFLAEKFSMIVAPIEDVCPREKLGYSVVEFYFLNDELAAYKIVVDHYDDTPEDEKLLLFEYVKKHYGDITDSAKPEFWRGFKFWDKKNEIAIYKKMDFHGILDEVLYISNEKYNETFSVYESGEGELEDKND